MGTEEPRSKAAAISGAKAACAGGTDKTPFSMGEEGVAALDIGGVGPRDIHPRSMVRGPPTQAVGTALLSDCAAGVPGAEMEFGAAILGVFALFGGPILI